MLHIRDNTGDTAMHGWIYLRSAMKSLLKSAWELLKAFVIDARDIFGTGRINL